MTPARVFTVFHASSYAKHHAQIHPRRAQGSPAPAPAGRVLRRAAIWAAAGSSRRLACQAGQPVTAAVVRSGRLGGGIPGSSRQAAVVAVCSTSLFMVAVDQTAVTVALPSIGRSLNTTLAGLQWAAAGYAIAAAALLMSSAAAAGRFGSRTVFQAGLAVFTAGSLYCSLAPDAGWLIAARLLQGAGGSALAPMSLALITRTFTSAEARTRVMGVCAASLGAGLAAGPVLGGLLIGPFGWRSVFWVNVPVGIAAIAATRLLVPASRAAPRSRAPGLPGQALVIMLLGALAYMIIEAPVSGWLSPPVAGCALAAAAAAVLLPAVESRRPEPLTGLRHFRSPVPAGAILAAAGAFAVTGGFLFLAVFYLQDVRGLTPLQAGLYMLPCAAGVLAAGPAAGQLLASRGGHWLLVAGGTALTLSCAALSRLTPGWPPAFLIAAFAGAGIGYGCMNAAVPVVAAAGLPPGQAEVAGRIWSSARLAGYALGICIAGSVTAAGLRGSWQAGFCPAAYAAWCIMAAAGFAVLTAGVASARQAALPGRPVTSRVTYGSQAATFRREFGESHEQRRR